ncbi:guanine nucleotide-binding protein alpha-12 subunit-like, partial [Varroa jacobsoni]|uniref:guanine nucleotide-binding protein alpha-12 subunit-like n=1 Tax=Varroa jacobsoni TaxID=62625 RepID=UPI000BF9F464
FYLLQALANLLTGLDSFFRKHVRCLPRKAPQEPPVQDEAVDDPVFPSHLRSENETREERRRLRKHQKQHSQRIDQMLKKDRKQIESEIKVLLLGPGESGKSTVLKQMRIIHNVNFTDEELQEIKEMIFQNVCVSMFTLCMERERRGISFQLKDSPFHWQSFRERFELSTRDDQRVSFIDFIKHALDIQELWRDQALRDTYDIRYNFKLSDSCSYFFSEIARIKQASYVPSQQDILFARRATIGIKEMLVDIPCSMGRGTVPFRFIDVGGQRSGRHLWRTVFHGVHAVLFLAPCSEFDQVLAENSSVNRLEESLRTFAWIINEQAFQSSCVILFLNKLDLLIEKVVIQQRNIRSYFPMFEGNPLDVEDVQRFILDMFRQRARKQAFYCHFTTATDTDLMRSLVADVKDKIVTMNLNQLILNHE